MSSKLILCFLLGCCRTNPATEQIEDEEIQESIADSKQPDVDDEEIQESIADSKQPDVDDSHPTINNTDADKPVIAPPLENNAKPDKSAVPTVAQPVKVDLQQQPILPPNKPSNPVDPMAQFQHKDYTENTPVEAILANAVKTKNNRKALSLSLFYIFLKTTALMCAFRFERMMIDHLRQPVIKIIQDINERANNGRHPGVFEIIDNFPIMGQLFYDMNRKINSSVMSEKPQKHYKYLAYSTFGISLLSFLLLSAFSVKLTERLFDIIFGTDMIKPFANKVSEDMSDRVFPRGLRKTTRASKDADISQIVDAFATFGPNMAQLITSDLLPFMIKLIALFARQPILMVSEGDPSILIAASLVGYLIYRNRVNLFSGIVDKSKEHYDSVRNLSADSSDVLNNILLLKSMATEKKEKKRRASMFKKMILAKKDLDKEVRRVDQQLFMYGIGYGMIHVFLGPGAEIFMPTLQKFGIITGSKTMRLRETAYEYYFDIIRLASILFSDLSFVKNTMHEVFKKYADIVINKNKIQEQIKIVFYSDELPVEPEGNNPLLGGQGEVVFDLTDAFKYLSYKDERTQKISKYATKLAEAEVEKAKKKLRKAQGLD